MEIDLEKTTNKYEIIYTDPAWQIKKTKRKTRTNQIDMDYPMMTLEEIKKTHELASALCEDKHNIFMWTIEKYLPQAEQIMKELGYEVHVRFIWDKGNGLAPAYTVRYAHEYLVWFKRKVKFYFQGKK